MSVHLGASFHVRNKRKHSHTCGVVYSVPGGIYARMKNHLYVTLLVHVDYILTIYYFLMIQTYQK